MYCPACGTENPDIAVFCQKCGKKIPENPKSPPVDQRTDIGTKFLDSALPGKNNIWRYVLGILIIYSVFYGYGILIPEEVDTWGPVVNYIIQDFVYVLFILAVIFVVKFLHKRSFHSLITYRKSIIWTPILGGFLIYFGLMFLLSFLLGYALDPSSLVFNPDLMGFLLFVPFLLVLVPLQTTSEELFFRGYLLQGLGFLTRNFFLLAIVNGILFMIPHLLNPEMGEAPIIAMLDWVVFGFIMALVTLKSGSIELAIGGHAANNLSIALLANYENSVMTTPSLFFSVESLISDDLAIILSLINAMLIPALFYILIFKVPKIRHCLVKTDV